MNKSTEDCKYNALNWTQTGKCLEMTFAWIDPTQQKDHLNGTLSLFHQSLCSLFHCWEYFKDDFCSSLCSSWSIRKQKPETGFLLTFQIPQILPSFWVWSASWVSQFNIASQETLQSSLWSEIKYLWINEYLTVRPGTVPNT